MKNGHFWALYSPKIYCLFWCAWVFITRPRTKQFSYRKTLILVWNSAINYTNFTYTHQVNVQFSVDQNVNNTFFHSLAEKRMKWWPVHHDICVTTQTTKSKKEKKLLVDRHTTSIIKSVKQIDMGNGRQSKWQAYSIMIFVVCWHTSKTYTWKWHKSYVHKPSCPNFFWIIHIS